MIAPRPLERTCWRKFVDSEEIIKKSQIVPMNVSINTIVSMTD